MLRPPFPETYAAVADTERALARARAEHRAPGTATAGPPRSVPAVASGQTAGARRGRLARAAGSLRRVLRPAHA